MACVLNCKLHCRHFFTTSHATLLADRRTEVSCLHVYTGNQYVLHYVSELNTSAYLSLSSFEPSLLSSLTMFSLLSSCCLASSAAFCNLSSCTKVWQLSRLACLTEGWSIVTLFVQLFKQNHNYVGGMTRHPQGWASIFSIGIVGMMASCVVGALHCLTPMTIIAGSRTESVVRVYLDLLSFLSLQPGCLLLMHLTQLFLCLRQQSRPDDRHKQKQR